MQHTIHWLGVGLSSISGIQRLAQSQHAIIVWNRSLDKALSILKNVKDNKQQALEVRQLDWQHLSATIAAGDVVVSMLPATMHIEVAQLCLSKQAHFVSSSYISPEMESLNQQAKNLNLSLVNEVGLDPGLDHLFAHLLVDDYQHSNAFSLENTLAFRSYCGGFPQIPNSFKYKLTY